MKHGDFEMPNWCQNVVYVSHPDKEKMDALVEALKQGAMFNHIVPMPEVLKGIVTGSATIDGVQVNEWRRDEDGNDFVIPAEELEAIKKEHGTASWYDWACEHWGTKWDVCNPWDTDEMYIDDDSVVHVFKFDTAWSPPFPVYEAMDNMGFHIRAEYVEYGMGFHGAWNSDGDNWHDNLEDDAEIDEHLQSEYA